MGQFEWKVVSMGLALASLAFQRLVGLVVKGIDNVVVYIVGLTQRPTRDTLLSWMQSLPD
jgi:hypothetical protein